MVEQWKEFFFNKCQPNKDDDSKDILPRKYIFQPNAVSIKGYWSVPQEGKPDGRKDAHFHCDTTYNKDNEAPDNVNSQLPGSPVIIATYGTPKKLQWGRTTDGKEEVIPDSKFFTSQNGNCFTVLDHNDEKWKFEKEIQKQYKFMQVRTS